MREAVRRKVSVEDFEHILLAFLIYMCTVYALCIYCVFTSVYHIAFKY